MKIYVFGVRGGDEEEPLKNWMAENPDVEVGFTKTS